MSAITVKHATLRNGLTLPYAETGDPGGTPIVFVHAYVESWRYFENVLELLPPSMHGYAPTQRGHGPPDRPGDSYRPEDFADDIEAFMSAVGLERPVLVGASSGGLVCQFLAAAHPDRVRALVLISTPASLADKPSAAGLWQQISALEDPLDRTFVEDFVRATSPGSLPDALVETLVGRASGFPPGSGRSHCAGCWRLPPPSTAPSGRRRCSWSATRTSSPPPTRRSS